MKLKPILLLLFMMALPVSAETVTPIHHLVVVWLKTDQGDDAVERYREASLPLQDLPGVLEYRVVRRAAITRNRPNPAVDDSFDLIVDSRFETAEALEAFLKHPEYVQIAQQQLRPLVDHYRIYDAVE